MQNEVMELIVLGDGKGRGSVRKRCPSSSEEDGQCESDEFLPPASKKRGAAKTDQPISPKKDITLLSGVALVAGQIIGSGIYVAPHIILTYAGSLGVSLLLWLLGAVIATCGGLCYVELGLLTKKSGGEFVYLTKAYSFKHRNRGVTILGSLLGFLSTWTDFCISRPSSMAVATLLCARYFIRPFFIGCPVPDLAVKCLAIAVLITICVINSTSVKTATRIITVLSATKVLSLAFIVAVGVAFLFSSGQYPEMFRRPFEPWDGYVTTPSALALALYGVLWSFDGWNSINYSIEEVSNLQRTLPLSLLIGIPIVTVCYVLVNTAYFAVLSYEQILHSEAVALPFGFATMGKVGLVLIPLMVGTSVFGSSTSNLLSGSRVTFAAARAGLLPRVLSGLHSSRKTPLPAIIVQGSMGCVLVWMGDISELIEGISAAIYLMYLLAIVGLIIMRFTYKEEPRLFKGWFIFPVAGFTIVMFLFLVFLPLLLQPIPSLVAFCVILLGVPVYLCLVMEKPWRFRPKLLDDISAFVNKEASLLLNTKSAVS